ncbi:hypothetical protein, partial [Acidovorax sp. SUPP2522]|uniref:hypothetical protein n=1 Tax=Acidovorax sp. SUPP2522 TaxID=511900 RepID=UPI0024E0952B
GCLDRSLMCISGSSCTPSQRTWTTEPAHQPSAKTEGTEKTLTALLPQQQAHQVHEARVQMSHSDAPSRQFS